MSGRSLVVRPHPRAEINLVPMIDVVLVLLVIFMAALHVRQVMPVEVPPPAPPDVTAPAPHLILALLADGAYELNGTRVSAGALARRLEEVFRERTVKVLFVRGTSGRTYAEVLHMIDVAKGAGAEVVGVVP